MQDLPSDHIPFLDYCLKELLNSQHRLAFCLLLSKILRIQTRISDSPSFCFHQRSADPPEPKTPARQRRLDRQFQLHRLRSLIAEV
jgi:hypothetical protein